MTIDSHVASDFARRALANIAREYPNHPQYRLESDADVVPPRVKNPIFFGCFDWHSAVHTHWSLLRLLRSVPELPERTVIENTLTHAFRPANVRIEADHLARHPSFERPYGLAWLMLLAADAADTAWREALAPLAAVARTNVLRWLAALRYPVRSGTHNQTAFALTLLFDSAETFGDSALLAAVETAARSLYSADTGTVLAFEPSGEDFLSPALVEADLMRRVFSTQTFGDWLGRFLPELWTADEDAWLPCGAVVDEADGKWVHLHGLNLSRAWNLENIAASLPRGDARSAALKAAAERHRDAGLRATLQTQHYAGDHWLPSFAVYLLTARSGHRRA